MSAEAHKSYGGIGTILVIKVSQHLQNVFRTEIFSKVARTKYLFLIFRLFLSLLVQVSAESASQFGELVADPTTNELLHYTEKPETFVCQQI